MITDIGKVLFNLQRFQILQTKLNPQTSNTIPNYYVYAWYVKLYPSLDQNELHEDLKEYFSVSQQLVDSVINYADNEWMDGRLYNFYEYEDFFQIKTGHQEGLSRSILIEIFRYSFLKGGFNQEFWDKLLEPMRHPSEAQLIKDKFNIDNLYFI